MSFAHPPDLVPSGTIIPANLSLSEVPEGWVVCDGNNGTPDLREKFVKSVQTASDTPGSIGGQASVSLTVGQLPSHSHGGQTPDNPNSHNHTWDQGSSYNSGDDGVCCAALGGDPNDFDTITTSTNGDHTHTDVSTNSTGGDGSFNNDPAYTEMTFIKKL